MARKYRNICNSEREIIEMFNNGITLREIGEISDSDEKDDDIIGMFALGTYRTI